MFPDPARLALTEWGNVIIILMIDEDSFKMRIAAKIPKSISAKKLGSMANSIRES
jgi:hypothetical protein